MSLRLMTYNIKAGRYHADGLEAVAQVIAAHAPDVLGLQEVDEGMQRSERVAQTDWLTRRLRMRGLYAPALELDGGRYGIALLSRLPIIAHERRLLFRPEFTDAASRPRHDSEQRVALAATLANETERLCVVVTHLGLSADQRAVQAQQVADFAAQWGEGRATIVMGDFNCDPDAPELAPLRARFRDACAANDTPDGARFTFPSGELGARTGDGWRGKIDTIWVSPGIRVLAARVSGDRTRASDHQPVVADCASEAVHADV